MSRFLFTSESVTEGHPDKICDQISDAILDAMIERSARLTAAVISSCVIKSGKGVCPTKPVCVLCNGTTFYKTHNLRSRIHGYLDKYLSDQRHLYFDIVAMDNDITLGTAIGALSSSAEN